MNRLKIALLFFTIIYSTYDLKAQEVQENGVKEVQIKSDSIAKDTIIPIKDITSFVKEKSYELGGITVIGLKKFEEETVKTFSGLKVGQLI